MDSKSPSSYMRGGVGLPTVTPRSMNKVRKSVEKTSTSSPLSHASNAVGQPNRRRKGHANEMGTPYEKERLTFKRQVLGQNMVSIEDEFSRKDSFRFPGAGNSNTSRNVSQARFSNSHRKSRTKTEQVSVQVSATGRMSYPTRANPNGGNRRIGGTKSGRNSNTSSNSSLNSNDYLDTSATSNSNFNYGGQSNYSSYHTSDSAFQPKSHREGNSNDKITHKNHGYAKEKRRRRRNINNHSGRREEAGSAKNTSIDSLHDSRMRAIFIRKPNRNYKNLKTPRKDADEGMQNTELKKISPSSAERIINEHGRSYVTNTPSPPPSANPNSDRKRPSRRGSSNLKSSNQPTEVRRAHLPSHGKINLPDSMKNITVETSKVTAPGKLVSIHSGSRSVGSARKPKAEYNVSTP